MTTKNTDSKLAFVTLCSTLEAGLNALPDATLTVDAVTSPKADFVQPLAVYVAAEADLTDKDTVYRAAVQKTNTSRVTARVVVGKLRPYLKARLGPYNPQLLSDFGVKPNKVPQRKVAVKAAAAAKGVATRSKKKAAAAAATAPVPPTPPTNGNKPSGT